MLQRKTSRAGLIALLALFVSAAMPTLARADTWPPETYNSPLFLNYTVTPSGGVFIYQFTLTLDNSDGSWIPGENFNWIDFGTFSILGGTPSSPLASFGVYGQELPIGPFNYTMSSGPQGEYVPTLLDNSNILHGGWIPTAVGDELTWSGPANVDLPIGDLYWSYLIADGQPFPGLGPNQSPRYESFIAGTHMLAPADQQIEILISTPEPSTVLLLGAGLLGLIAVRPKLVQTNRAYTLRD
jgi:hypothetical protein